MSSFRPQVPNSPPIPRSASASKPPNPNPQTQSPFLQRLPAELRNQIYTLVFTPTTTTSQSVPPHNRPPHPLNLLQTCRLIHHEAHLIAFTTYTFSLHADAYPLPPRPQYDSDYRPTLIHPGIQSRTSLLSSTHLSSIKSLTLHHGSGNNTSRILSWLLSTLPSLTHITLLTSPHLHPLCPRSQTAAQEPDLQRFRAHNQRLPLPPQEATTYAPHVLVETCYSLIGGTQHTSPWHTHWPQSESAGCYTRLSCEDGGQVREELVMDEDGVDEDLGIRMCGCDRGPSHVVWTKAVLVQAGLAPRSADTMLTGLVVRGLETPRGVTVSVEEELPEPRVSVSPAQQCQLPTTTTTTVLVPGAVPLTLSEVIVNGGGGFEGSEEYWAGLRQRQRQHQHQRNLGAIVQNWWRSTPAPPQKNTSSTKPTR